MRVIRHINEIIAPHLLDQRAALENQFSGMSEEDFSYEDYESVREELIRTIHQNLTLEDKRFLLSLKNPSPAWDIYDFERFPAVKWKLKNLQDLKDSNPEKYQQQFKALKEKLDNF